MKTIAARMVSRVRQKDCIDAEAQDYGKDEDGFGGECYDHIGLLYMLECVLSWEYIKQQGLTSQTAEYKAIMRGLSALSQSNFPKPLAPGLIAKNLELGAIPWDIGNHLATDEPEPSQVLSFKRFEDLIKVFYSIMAAYELQPYDSVDKCEGEWKPWQLDGESNLIECARRDMEHTQKLRKLCATAMAEHQE